MRILDAGFDLERFFADLARSPHPALLLDYDGTLAPFHVDPARAAPYAGVPALLDRIMTGRTRLILISGRWTRDLIPLLGVSRLPEIWGSHGFERRFADGRYDIARPDTEPLRGLANADTWGDELRRMGARLEQKPASLAVHWRGLPPPQARAIEEKVREKWMSRVRATGLELHPFDGGLELRVPGRDKGYAVRTLLDESPSDVAAAFLGDDLTDEDALRAIRGRGLGVLVRPTWRETVAQVWLQPPEELLAFLERWAQVTARR
ncbi:trehalose-phosphatase [Sulfurifustis variabilis]|uniref:Trehalose 6-phosphate phosphatase n=1 Tax=Sulfurifustis variabilis TaxID=1675686 RepID=A0A1B4V5U4_9GAMM|nr:trehalose-phosphatase [Sulfurifustis variabilis]BAU48919.1 trehalose-phosphatase [Sulfurifustis variabilis]